MKLDRNQNPDGKGKYALLNLRKNKIEWGCAGDEDEFFVLKLKDRYARAALVGYLEALTSEEEYDVEYAMDIQELARRAGPLSPYCKKPD